MKNLSNYSNNNQYNSLEDEINEEDFKPHKMSLETVTII